VTSERDGVEIDYCPSCWGIWLDKGELNILLERAQVAVRANPTVATFAPASPAVMSCEMTAVR
jgi:Zn-finger nucleic acid-binding protein